VRSMHSEKCALLGRCDTCTTECSLAEHLRSKASTAFTKRDYSTVKNELEGSRFYLSNDVF
jgi:hypothetical protein